MRAEDTKVGGGLISDGVEMAGALTGGACAIFVLVHPARTHTHSDAVEIAILMRHFYLGAEIALGRFP